MHPKQLLDHCTALTAHLLRFEHPAETVVGRYFREQRALGPRERSTVAETVYAILRKKPLFEWLARSGRGAPERRLAILGFAGARHVLLAALSPEEQQWLAACDQAKADTLPEALTHNLPQWLAEALQTQLGPRFDAAAAALLQAAPLDLRINILQTKRSAVLETLQREGIAATATPYSPWGIRLADKPAISRLELFRNGHIEVQDEGSQLLALLLDARRGEMVADFCAGAGGKTLALGAAMRNTGRLYALDTSAHRLEQLKSRLARSGLENVYPMAIADEHDERLQRLAGKIDRVLVDAPCSGLGTQRRQPDLKWRQTPDQVQAFTERQKSILSQAAHLLKPGGRLVYATCSLLPAENEAVALEFSAAQGALFTPLNATQLLQGLKVQGAAQLCIPATNAFGVEAGRYLRLWPDLHGTDGFFGAAWQKAG